MTADPPGAKAATRGGPKIEACARFTAPTGRPSAIGALTAAAAVLVGTAGTTVTGPQAIPADQRRSIYAAS